MVAELGEHARAGSSEDAAEAGDLVVVTIPFESVYDVPVEPLAGKVVIGTNNCDFERDGHFPDQPAYGAELAADELRDALARAA
jgi:8-hydroxy-5-deazaflavin:NADPH oxidoreductase